MTGQSANIESGRFRWNAGGWYGGQIGGTAWLLVGAAVISSRSLGIASVWAACFAVANVVGVLLWLNRSRLQAYPAIQMLILTCGFCGLVAFAALKELRPDVIEALGWTRSYAAFLIFPAVMTWFAIMERSAQQ